MTPRDLQVARDTVRPRSECPHCHPTEARCPCCGEEVRRDDRGVFGRTSNLACPTSPNGKHTLTAPAHSNLDPQVSPSARVPTPENADSREVRS